LKNSKGRLFNFISIVSGSCAFAGFGLSYASFTIYSLDNLLKAALAIISASFLALFIATVYISAGRYAKKMTKIRNVLIYTAAAAVGGWLLTAGGIWLLRYEVLYTNSPVRQDLFTQVRQQKDFEKISIAVQGDITLRGYLYKPQCETVTPLAIYFGGRGEEASGIIEYASKIKGCSMAFINYRGCGLSGGSQNEENLLSDAAAVYDCFAARNDIDKNNIFLIAHSLGTGIAIHLASERGVKGIILSAAYDSYTSGVIQDKFPLIPVGMLFPDEFDSLAAAPGIKVPALFLLAEKDKTISRKRTLELFNRWGGKAEKVTIAGTHHENITLSDSTWKYINSFLNKMIN
jgi:predicted alpha/beta hydrolase family esterase